MTGTITADMLAPGTALANLEDGTIPFSKMTPASVTEDKLANGSVTNAKVPQGGLNPDRIKGGVVAPTDFKMDFGLNGSAKLPGGLILKWGHEGGHDGDYNVTFVEPFPNSCINISATINGYMDANVLLTVAVDNQGLEAFSIRIRSVTQGRVQPAAAAVFWFAIGC